jgi:tetratricopeptide (TPR) repeat protein
MFSFCLNEFPFTSGARFSNKIFSFSTTDARVYPGIDLNDKVGMARDYSSISDVLRNMGNYHEALDSYNNALKIHGELNDRVGMANDYYNISFVLSETSKEEALKSLNNALTILQEFERVKGYRHPLMDRVNSRISDLKG